MLIFLDIDGVMVPAKSWKSPELLNDGFPAFSSKATNVLKRVISEDDLVILTTSHKSNYTIKEWKQIFSNRGIEVKNLNKLQDNVSGFTRREEIVNWFNLNDTSEDFIIIDDDKSLNDLPEYIKSNLVLTGSLVGLTFEHIELIEAIMFKDEVSKG